MFHIGICFFDEKKNKELYMWLIRLLARQRMKAELFQYQDSKEVLAEGLDYLIVDKVYQDSFEKKDVAMEVYEGIEDRSVLVERLNQKYRQYLSDQESYVFYQRPDYIRESLSNVIYFLANKRKVTMVCTNGIYEFYQKLDVVEQEIKEKNVSFIRTHRSYLINKKYIKSFSTREIILYNGVILTISRTRKNQTKDMLYCLS